MTAFSSPISFKQLAFPTHSSPGPHNCFVQYSTTSSTTTAAIHDCPSKNKLELGSMVSLACPVLKLRAPRPPFRRLFRDALELGLRSCMQGCGYLAQCEPNMHAITCAGSRVGVKVNQVSHNPGSCRFRSLCSCVAKNSCVMKKETKPSAAQRRKTP